MRQLSCNILGDNADIWIYTSSRHSRLARLQDDIHGQEASYRDSRQAAELPTIIIMCRQTQTSILSERVRTPGTGILLQRKSITMSCHDLCYRVTGVSKVSKIKTPDYIGLWILRGDGFPGKD